MSKLGQNGLMRAFVLLAGLALAGCGKDATPPPGERGPFADAPFVLVPDKEGKLVLLDAKGKSVAPHQGPLPENIKAIRDLTQVTVLKIEGSCYYTVVINGRYYQIPC